MNIPFFSQQDLDLAVRLVVATFLGGLIGFERESNGKDAGVRTYSLVCLGSALFMILSFKIFEMYRAENAGLDPSRIAAQIVSGIGFLGAGAIMRFEKSVKGLTTAAGIWTAAGIGMACGLGLYHAALITTALALTILIAFAKLDQFFGGKDF
jgi:putative Mg2+ transporter-C (MgtC) family protein